jgi:septin family protein
VASKLCVNQPLVEIVQRTLGEESTSSQTPTSCDFQIVMPKGLNFKIAMLGQAFSGKKTLAKQLVEKLGGDVKILNMDEILKEALDYINPKKVAEVPVVDPKAKGKAPVAAVVVPTDIFEGKDNVAYKNIANEIKQKFFTADELP